MNRGWTRFNCSGSASVDESSSSSSDISSKIGSEMGDNISENLPDASFVLDEYTDMGLNVILNGVDIELCVPSDEFNASPICRIAFISSALAFAFSSAFPNGLSIGFRGVDFEFLRSISAVSMAVTYLLTSLSLDSEVLRRFAIASRARCKTGFSFVARDGKVG